MKVKISTVNQDTGEETPQGECYLSEALDRDDPEFNEALDALQSVGRYWCGGGAAALSLLVKIPS